MQPLSLKIGSALLLLSDLSRAKPASIFPVERLEPSSSLSNVPATLQGLKKLAVGRTDPYHAWSVH